jgi:hypothetical protein
MRHLLSTYGPGTEEPILPGTENGIPAVRCKLLRWLSGELKKTINYWQREIFRAEAEMAGEEDRKRNPQVSRIPIPEMKRLMHLFGPEKFEPKNRHRKSELTEGSLKRKFHQWFPNFGQHFTYDKRTGKFHANIGDEEEVKRRQRERAHMAYNKPEKKNYLMKINGEPIDWERLLGPGSLAK